MSDPHHHFPVLRTESAPVQLATAGPLASPPPLRPVAGPPAPEVRLPGPDGGGAEARVPDRAALRGARTHLTEREVRMVGLLAAGRSTREVGRELHLSEAMVKQTLKYAFAVSGTSTRAELVAWAMRRGLVA